ncbi:ABC transporter ATP-binding protein [Sneathia sanguinegens]|uniref:ABC transporter ATP-binding protein n=1 Tax=Sneathia sanguinegens TaxID=40543 RepID=A0ABT7HM26_9FUSO|nr:ABC transporter ATP-binding protein [Sneathia sanguinegens]MDK9581140.1 ABC transporter ATP-binding protein [Sneathia sanguinegens]
MMRNWINKTFALNNKSSNNILIAIFYSLLVNIFSGSGILLLLLFFYKKLDKISYIFLAILILIILAISLGLEYNKLYYITYNESANLRIKIGNQLKNLPLPYFSKHDLSDLAQTIISDIAKMEHAISHALAQTIAFVLFFILVSIAMLYFNFYLAMAIIIPFIINILILFLTKKVQIKSNTKYYKILRKNSESFQENIELQQEIQSLNLEKEMKEKLYIQMDETEKIHFEVESFITALLSLINLLFYIEIGVLILIGSYLFYTNKISLISLISFLLISLKLNEGSLASTLNITELFYIDARVKRLKEIINYPTQKGKDITLKSFDIQLTNVSFSYENEQILKDINFVAKQNEITALVGKSGSGKSTLLKLISRLEDYNSGKICIDKIDIKDISTASLFKNISIVFQDVILFNDTILENIRVGNLNASDEEVIKAAQKACCDEFVEKLPNKYNTLIGENGTSLSSGQRQRISIARAFLKNAKILLLDEISSSLDVDNEIQIQKSLQNLVKEKTVIVISHRIKSIENVDKIVVIDEGKVCDSGTHNELLNRCKIYKDLVTKSELGDNFIF